MPNLTFPNGISLISIGKISVVIGRNGSGKSTLLRSLDSQLASSGGCVRYITPERGGELIYDGSIDTIRGSQPRWISDNRRKNRFEQFRQTSVAEFRNLETLVLRSIEKDPEVRKSAFSFDSEVEKINGVLDRVRIERSDSAGFGIVIRATGQRTAASELSSGEAELISLAVEVLYFCYLSKLETNKGKENWLLIDEPDVHLHPDLQHRLMKVLLDSLKSTDARVLIATHSTSIIASLVSSDQEVKVGFKRMGSDVIEFKPISEAYRNVLPVFGAHPLSSVFNATPPVIVEGEDDERIWQTAVRSSGGRLAFFPCVAVNKQSIHGFEIAANEIIQGVYDDAVAFSIRDRDDEPYDIEDFGSVRRARLNCRSAENLILSDDVLHLLGTNWESLATGLDEWISVSDNHSRHKAMISFRDSGWDRRNHPIKDLRMLLVGLSGSDKPWEVAVGQAIARLNETQFDGPNSLSSFLGPKAVAMLGLGKG